MENFKGWRGDCSTFDCDGERHDDTEAFGDTRCVVCKEAGEEWAGSETRRFEVQ